MDIKTIAIFLPFLNAVLYGLYYALLEQNYQKISLPTAMLSSAFVNVLSAILLVVTRNGQIDFTPLADRQSFIVYSLSLLVGVAITIIMYLAMKYTSATYMAFAELGYPLFVPIFAYLLFGRQNFSWSLIIGGVLVMIGCYVILLGKMKTQ